jgi:hypothetical protein
MTDREFIEEFAAQAVRFVGCVDEDNTRSFEVLEVAEGWQQARLTSEHFGHGRVTLVLEFCERKLDNLSCYWFGQDGLDSPYGVDAEIAMEILDLYRQMKAEAEAQP